MEKIQLTKEGYDKLTLELRDLIDNQREDNKRQLVEARSQGDLSENADYDAARARQAEIEGRINEIEHILNNCVIIENGKRTTRVGLGSKVRIRRLDNNVEETYTITGTTEANPFENKISNISPLGEALMGHKIGEIVTVNCKNEYQVEILEPVKK